MQAAATQKQTLAGTSLRVQAPRARSAAKAVVLASSAKKTDPKKQGVNSVENETVRNNLLGSSRVMGKKGWTDPQGRKGKGLGVYRFSGKYGVNVDGYSPIYTPDTWAQTGSTYQLGSKGLIAWAGLLVVLLAVGINLVVSTSAIGQ